MQQVFNGIFEANNVTQTNKPLACLDDNVMKSSVALIGELLQKGAKGSVADLISLADIVSQYLDSIPTD
jgi:hypothetical protein